MSETDSLKASFDAEMEKVRDSAGLEALRVGYLGRKGLVTEKMKLLSGMSEDERRAFGKAINELKAYISVRMDSKKEAFKYSEVRAQMASESLDVTLPGRFVEHGRPHPITSVLDEIIEVFTSMGFGVEEGPEVELDYYNFEALNIPKDHPARDMQDTFYISDDVVMRTHTSPVQVRVMEKRKPPLRFVAPGKVYRCDADVSHTPMFHQVEGLMVDTDITFGHLKGVLEVFIHRIFSADTPVRFRPSFFSFTEPSAEADIGCIFCKGKGCRVCKNSGWIEILGAGMVNPRVFEMAGYPTDAYTGFAFGMGIERIAMLKFGIDDIRLFFENDLRFLRQF